MRGLASPHPIMGASRCVPLLVGFRRRQQWQCTAGFTGDKATCPVLLSRRQVQDTRHHGRYGREGQRMLLLICKALVHDSPLSGVGLA